MIKRPLLFMMAMLTTLVMSQAQTKSPFTLDDVIPGGSRFYANMPENIYIAWWGEKCVLLGMDDLHVIQPATGEKEEITDLATINGILQAHGLSRLSHLYYATFPESENPLVKVESGKTYALIDWVKKELVWRMDVDQRARHADWNEKSRNLAYTINHNLFVQTADGAVHQVSHDGSLDLVYGESVHRQEFGINKGTFWSPDGMKLAFYRMDQSMVTTYPQVDISTRCATLDPDKYPMAGETSHQVTVGVFNPADNTTVYMDAGDPTDRYFTNIAWSPDGSKLYIIELNRDQNHAQLVRYDADTGTREAVLVEERNDKYVEPMHPIMFLPWNDKQFVCLTRKDGWLHFYLHDANGKQIRQLTKGNFEVNEFVGFDEQHKRILFTSNQADPLQQNLFSVDMQGKVRPLGTPEGYHSLTCSEKGGWAFDNYSAPDVARKIDLINTSTGQVTNLLTADDPYQRFEMPEISVGKIKAADGTTDVYYRLIKPVGFDPSKKYPAVVYVYGGPHAHNIDATRFWGARGWDLYMAQLGYVMFCLDNRGSENRGLAFEQATFRHLGEEEMKDQMKGVDFLQSLPYVDSQRIGVHGWSFGGFMTTGLMTTYPEVFKVGVAGGPVIDWKYYEVMYGERYMDTPQTNPDGYQQSSLLPRAGNLKGRLLIIYGGNDDTCVPQHTLSFMRACIDAGTHPDLFVYPGDGHNMTGTDRVHLHEHITRYFQDFLK